MKRFFIRGMIFPTIFYLMVGISYYNPIHIDINLLKWYWDAYIDTIIAVAIHVGLFCFLFFVSLLFFTRGKNRHD